MQQNNLPPMSKDYHQNLEQQNRFCLTRPSKTVFPVAAFKQMAHFPCRCTVALEEGLFTLLDVKANYSKYVGQSEYFLCSVQNGTVFRSKCLFRLGYVRVGSCHTRPKLYYRELKSSCGRSYLLLLLVLHLNLSIFLI